MDKNKIISQLSEYWGLHWLMYLCLFIFMVVTMVICILAYALFLDKKECREDTRIEPVAVTVFINNNDTIISTLSSEIKELKNMMQRMQEDTLCVAITKGNK